MLLVSRFPSIVVDTWARNISAPCQHLRARLLRCDRRPQDGKPKCPHVCTNAPHQRSHITLAAGQSCSGLGWALCCRRLAPCTVPLHHGPRSAAGWLCSELQTPSSLSPGRSVRQAVLGAVLGRAGTPSRSRSKSRANVDIVGQYPRSWSRQPSAGTDERGHVPTHIWFQDRLGGMIFKNALEAGWEGVA